MAAYASLNRIGLTFQFVDLTPELLETLTLILNNRPVLVYPIELIKLLNSEGWAVKPGDLGENITTKGIDYNKFVIGKKFQLGDGVIIEISQICRPCSNLSSLSYIGNKKVNQFVKTLVGRRGMFAKVLVEGNVNTNDIIKEL